MSAIAFSRDGVSLFGDDVGSGSAVVFQHGLGGDGAQAAEVFPDGPFRRLTLECRAHGRSEPGDPRLFSIATFANDVLAFAEARGIGRFVAGGISMGAAIALRLAVKAKERVRALILVRPAWDWRGAPDNLRPVLNSAPFVARGAREKYAASPEARELQATAPDNLASLIANFDRPDAGTRAALLAAIAVDGPSVSEEDVRRLRLPTLVIGTAGDVIHPLDLALRLAAAIPRARFIEVAPKLPDRARYVAEVKHAIADFLLKEPS